MPGDLPQLIDGPAGTTGDGERQPRVVKESPARGVLGRIDQVDRATGQASRVERGNQQMVANRARRAQGVASDAKHDGVAALQDTRCVCEHVGTTLEHERHDAERRAPRLDGPTFVIDRGHDPQTIERETSPHAQTRCHVGAHLRGYLQAADRPTASSSRFDIDCIRGEHVCERMVVLDEFREKPEEVVDATACGSLQHRKAFDGVRDRGIDNATNRRRNDEDCPR